jgi:translation initiation factor IF-2
MRDSKKKFQKFDEVVAAAGIKIAAPNLDDVVSGSPLRVLSDDENVEEELVPVQQQPKRQVEQQNHNTNSRNNQSQHHSEEEKKTKIWPIILFIIAFLLWLFF